MTLKELLEKKAGCIKAAADLRDVAASESRDLSETELGAIDKHLADAEAVDAEIKAAEDRQARAEAMNTRLNAATAQLGQSGGRRSTADGPGVAATTGLKERVQDDPKRGFRSMGDFASLVSKASTPGKFVADERIRILAAATGDNQTQDSEGGFLVPPSFATTIWDGMNVAPNNLMDMCDRYTVDGESLTFPANAETSRATGSRYGGVQGYWISEAQQITSSRPRFRTVKVEPQQVAALIYCTDKLLRNSPVALDQYVNRAATSELLFLMNDSIINGTGAGQPKGILAGTAGTTSCRVKITKEVGQAAATIVKQNIDKMYARLHPNSLPNSVWFVNIDTLPQLQQLSAVVGVGGVPVYLPAGGIMNAPNAMLYGRPVIPIEFAATCGTEGDIIFADMKSYLLGVRGGIETAMSMHLRFDYAESCFRFIAEVDGQPWLASPITPFKGSNTLSPFVTVETRS